jgi:hypothetical protein
MSASFASHTFKERGSSGMNNPGWDRKMNSVVKIIPNGSPVVQWIGIDVQRLAMPISCTASELSILYSDVEADTHSLVWSGGTDDACLESIDTPLEVMPGHDLYVTVLHFIKV